MLASCCCSLCVSGVCSADCAQNPAVRRLCPTQCLDLTERPAFRKYLHYVMHALFLAFAFVVSYVCLNPSVASHLPKIPMINDACPGGHAAPKAVPGALPHGPPAIVAEMPLDNTTESGAGGVYCYGINMIYRISLALTIYYLVHAVLALTLRRGFLDCYFIRWFGFFAIIGIFAFLPAIVVKIYAWISMPLAAVFLLMMVIIWVDFAYEWHQMWVKRHNIRWMYAIRGLTVLFTAGALALSIASLVVFDCTAARVWVSVNMLLGSICYVFAYKMADVDAFPVSIIVLYNTYVTYQALNYGLGLDDGCYYHAVSLTSNPIAFSTVLDTLLTLISLVWTAFSIANSHHLFSMRLRDYTDNIFYTPETVTLEEGTITIVSSDEPPDPVAQLERQREQQEREVSRFRFFFLVMLLASCYMLMTLSSWQVYGHSVGSRIDSGLTSMYIKFASTYAGYLVFWLFAIIPSDRFPVPTIYG